MSEDTPGGEGEGVIGLNLYGVKTKLRPAEVPAPPTNSDELGRRIVQHLLSLADSCAAWPAEALRAGRSLIRSITAISEAKVRQIEAGNEAATKLEARRQEALEKGATKAPPADLALEHLESVLTDLRVAGVSVEILRVAPGKVAISLTARENSAFAMEQAKLAVLEHAIPAIKDNHAK